MARARCDGAHTFRVLCGDGRARRDGAHKRCGAVTYGVVALRCVAVALTLQWRCDGVTGTVGYLEAHGRGEAR